MIYASTSLPSMQYSPRVRPSIEKIVRTPLRGRDIDAESLSPLQINQPVRRHREQPRFERAAPLVDRLATKTITRRRYRLLRALIVEASLQTGQTDMADFVLHAMERQWHKCPLRYLWP